MTERFDPFATAGPRWFTIAAHRPFLKDLARGIVDWVAGEAPDMLADAVVLLPNRRAARALVEAFGELGGQAPLLLPRIRPLGDLEEDEPSFTPGETDADLAPAIPPLTRRFELARIVAAHDARAAEHPRRALELGEALGRFLDSCQIEEVDDPARVAGLVGADMAEHWQVSADFLSLAVREWPKRLAELEMMDAAERRVILLNRLADDWTERPPAHLVIAAGSTGTVPAAARVLKAVAEAPSGCVVLPGLDLNLDDRAWAEIKESAGEQHPQGALKRLIDRSGVARAYVRRWPGDETPRRAARVHLIGEALKPPAATADWLGAVEELRRGGGDPIAEGLDGLTYAAARTEDQAAAVAAVLMRRALETPGQTVALVTPDPDMARRTQARLARWGLQADSSAGDPLSILPLGVLAGLVAAFAAEPFSAATVLAILKHPAVTLGLDADTLKTRRRALERYGLRGPHLDGWDALHARLEAARVRNGEPADATVQAAIDEAAALIAPLAEALSPAPTGRAAPDAFARGLTQAMEALAGGPGLWRGPDGEAMARLLSALIAEGAAMGPVSAADFRAILDSLMGAQTVRTGGATHPRLRILGAIEARLVQADVMILAGLEEGVWPGAAATDPFLSRPMRQVLGLPPPERRVGLSAHDFAQAASAKTAILLHTERRGGQPSVKSRWLWRLETLVRGAYPQDDKRQKLPRDADLPALAAALDAPDTAPPVSLRPALRPAPRPPVESRPVKLSVTDIEKWVRDPYSIYAKAILKLSRLERPDERVDALMRGTAIHAALERFALDWPDMTVGEEAATFEALYLSELRAAGMPEAALARETALARNIADWATGFEIERRAGNAQVEIERKGEIVLPSPRGSFTLTARADRIEVKEGRVSVIDFKTGSAPTWKQVRTGFSPQLSLTAAMALRGGFQGIQAGEAGQLLYVAVTGRKPPARVSDVSGDDQARDAQPVSQTVEEAIAGLQQRILDYEDGRAYRSRTAPQFAQRAVSDYDHLARVREWSSGGGEDEA